MNHRLQHIFNMFENVLRENYNGEDIRDTQVKLGIAIADLIASNNKILMCHAPVGTGKTFGALVPGAYDTPSHQSRLIYSTSSLNLQAQLKNEELRFLKEHGDIKSFLVAKGITNYLCMERIEKSKLGDAIKSDLIRYTIQPNVEGDRVDFEKSFYALTDDQWAQVRLERLKDCLYCGKKTMCPTSEHRSKFNDTQINVVVTNHNQLVQSVLNIQEAKPPILNLNIIKGLIVIDEAHDFEDAILSQLADRITLEDFMKVLRKMKYDRRRNLFDYLSIIKRYINDLKRDSDINRGRHKLSESCMTTLFQIKVEVNKEISEQAARKLDYGRYKRSEDEENEADIIAGLLGKILDTANYSSWISFEDDKVEITVVSKKFRVKARNIIKEMLTSNKVVFMSGTLAVNNSFDSIYYSWNGRFPNSKEVILETVFNYKKQAMVYIPKDLPDPVPSSMLDAFQDYSSILADEIIKLIKITGGRTLILCTSHKQMALIAKFIQPELDQLGITLLKQKDKSIELLSDEFKKNETSVLIGTGSLFAGLSIPGRSLISVILCRLPFQNAEDPFMELLGEGLSLPEKMEYLYVPRMIIKLLQAAGRLIRTKNDFGCFTILDPRVFKERERYGDKVLGELAAIGYSLTREREEVDKFIKNNFQQPQNISYPPYNKGKLVIPESLSRDDNPRTIPKELPVDKSSLSDFVNTITKNQRTYYELVRKRAGMTTVMPNSVNTPYDVYKHLKLLAINRELTFNVDEEFPFLTSEQKQSYIKRFDIDNKKKVINKKPTKWTSKQIETRFDELKIKKHKSVREWEK